MLTTKGTGKEANSDYKSTLSAQVLASSKGDIYSDLMRSKRKISIDKRQSLRYKSEGVELSDQNQFKPFIFHAKFQGCDESSPEAPSYLVILQ